MAKDLDRFLGELDAVCDEVVRPNAAAVDREARHPVESWAALGRIGALRLRIPERHGGLDVDLLTYVQVLERIATCCAASAMTMHMHAAACEIIARGASEESQRQWFPLTVDELALFASWGSEPTSSASRGFHSDTTVQPVGDRFVVNGNKYFCTMAGAARRAMVYCALVDESGIAPQGPQQIRSVFIDTASEGLSVSGAWDPVGMRGTVSPAVTLRDCVVEPAEVLPGMPELGVAEKLPLGFSAVILGSATGALLAAAEYLQKKSLVDMPGTFAEEPLVQRHFGRQVVRLDAARATLYDAAQRWGDPDGVSAAVRGCTTKLVVSDAALSVTAELMQIVGGNAAMRSLPLERAFRDVRTATLMPPNPDRMSLVVGAAALGRELGLFTR